ncbi:hypothetical protein KBD61_02375 [Patescibacteria group bacterium]|nr:hypothetical protein [Patescibacteria group bacterium]MBP9709855.1 hypothetical protein [Patescibacteria group bacterium]
MTKLYLSDDEAHALWWRIMLLSAEDNDVPDDDEAQLVADTERDLNSILLSWMHNHEAGNPEELVAAFPKFSSPNLLLARYIRFLATSVMETPIDITFSLKGRVYRLLLELADTYKLPG